MDDIEQQCKGFWSGADLLVGHLVVSASTQVHPKHFQACFSHSPICLLQFKLHALHYTSLQANSRPFLQASTRSPYLHVMPPEMSPCLQRQMQEERTVLMVAESLENAAVVGLVLIWCVADEAQIMEVAVLDGCQGQGVGTQLLGAALEVSIRSGSASACKGFILLCSAFESSGLCKANMLALQLQSHLHIHSADTIEGA